MHVKINSKRVGQNPERNESKTGQVANQNINAASHRRNQEIVGIGRIGDSEKIDVLASYQMGSKYESYFCCCEAVSSLG